MGGHDTKRLLRETVRAFRRRLAGEWAAARSAETCARVLGSPAFARVRRLVAYSPADGEVDPGTVIEAARAADVPVYLPRLEGTDLAFVAPAGPLRPGAHGIPEPAAGERLTDAGPETTVLVPGVAFDFAGGRLGRGGGHYDRALAAWPDATTVGLAFEFQVIPRLPHDAWDVPVSTIVTEHRLIVGCPGADVGRR